MEESINAHLIVSRLSEIMTDEEILQFYNQTAAFDQFKKDLYAGRLICIIRQPDNSIEFRCLDNGVKDKPKDGPARF